MAVERALGRLAAEQLGIDMAEVLRELVANPDDDDAVVAVDQLENDLRVAGEWEQLVDVYLARVTAAIDSPTRALHLSALADLFETELDDADRALTVSFEAFRELPQAALVDHLVRRADASERWSELAHVLSASIPAAAAHHRVAILRALAATHAQRLDDPGAEIACLEQLRGAAPPDASVLTTLAERYRDIGKIRDRMSVLAELAAITEDLQERATMYREMAAECERVGNLDRAAHYHEWVLSCEPDEIAFCSLERIYRSERRWRAAIDVYCRHADVSAPSERCWIYAQIAGIYETELDDIGTAIDFYDKANRSDPGRVEIVRSLARLDVVREKFDEAVEALESCAELSDDVGEQAACLSQAGTIALEELHDADHAEALLRRALELGPNPQVAALLGRIAADRGDLSRAQSLMRQALVGSESAAERAGLLSQLGQLSNDMGDAETAIDLYQQALEANDNSEGVHEALVELYTRTDQRQQLCFHLRALAERATKPTQERRLLKQLLDVATELADDEETRRVLERLIDLDPGDANTHLELSSLLMAGGLWQRAGAVLSGVLERFEDSLSHADCVDAHYRLGCCELESGHSDRAHLQFSTALALDPHHRPSLLARVGLGNGGPSEIVADKLALVASSPAETRAALLAEIGDHYATVLDDKVTARTMYRDALAYDPTDHVLLNKCLGLVLDHCDWTQSADMREQLIATERDPLVRAKYRHVGARVLSEKLGRQDDAIAMLHAALEDDPTAERIARDLEEILSDRGDDEELVRYYYARLETLQTISGAGDERVRAWTELGKVCLRLDDRDDALCAFEVAARLDAGNSTRRARLANLYVNSGPDYYTKAIEQHQVILRDNKGRMASYHALRGLYRLTEQTEAETACANAIDVLGVRAQDEPAALATIIHLDAAPRGVDGSTWTDLTNRDIDRLLANLFAIAAPGFSALRGRSAHQLGLRSKHRIGRSDRRRFARLAFWVADCLGIQMPDVYVAPDQRGACRIALCRDERGVRPVVMLGAPALRTEPDERALAFAFARQLLNLRRDRIARVVFRNAADLSKVIDAAVSLASGATPSATAESMAAWLSPLDLDQVTTIGERLAERGLRGHAAAADWLAAVDRGGARVGYVVSGDLAACSRALRGDQAGGRDDFIMDLAWSSVTPDMRELRRRMEPRRRPITVEPAQRRSA